MEEFHKIRIEGNGLVGTHYRVYLDDKEISGFTKEINIQIGVGKANKVKLELIGEIELPDDLIAIVVATQPPPNPGEDD